MTHNNKRHSRFVGGRSRRGSTLVLVMMMLALVMVPLVGLAIDGTMLYIIQAKLGSACDGAALGAGRLLGTNADTNEIAGEFLKANFPDGFWGTRNLHPVISSTNNFGTHTINVSATVEAPLLFMRVLGGSYSAVATSATATRRDVRTVLVLDRSGSMNTTDPVSHLNVYTTTQASANQFIGMFTPGKDEMGLVVFGGSGLVAYPSYSSAYNFDVHSTGGPDVDFATSATAGPVNTAINTALAGGGTNMSEALTLAYIELQKGHYRDLALNGQDNNVNAIVLFTDGVPSAVSVNPNDLVNNALKSTSTCTYNPETAAASTQMRGWIASAGSPPTWSGASQGMYLLALYDTTHTLTWWLQHPTSDQTTPQPSTAVAGCAGLGRTTSTYNLNDLARLPITDLYGNRTDGTGYSNSTLSFNGTLFDPTKPTQPYHLGIAAWNATDAIGKTIRSQTIMNGAAIYSIAYNGNGGTDTGLLKRLSNTLDSSSYQPSEQTGSFYQVSSADQLGATFAQVASEILRLSY